MPPPARLARTRRRHFWLLLSFLLLVVLPTGLSFGYLYQRANDQYGSTLGFAVRSEEYTSPLELIGGIASLSSGGTNDTDVLYEYIQSQQLVERIDAKIDLRGIFSKAEEDPVFAFRDGGSIEDLLGYWNRMVVISYDGGTQLIEVVAKAFTAADAQAVTKAILAESTELVNRLNLSAREDATRYAKEELDRAVERLKDARAALTEFRSTTQIIDPSTNLAGQMGLVSQLEGQLAAALIEADLLGQTTAESDPRLTQARRKIEVIQDRIAAERTRLAGSGAIGAGEGTLSTLVGDFERLQVDVEFGQEAYLAALSTYDTAVGEAQRQSRYLAAYIEPTLAQSAQYPERLTIGALIGVFFLFSWGLLVLIYYSIRDRR
ncbi:MAG: sugar transporter [Gammaproteobacteria bacterium]|nr:sugar transporter [Gammaproteobacteria bacterium]